MKLKEVPTFLLGGLTEEKEREIVIRDNISNGEWEMSALQEWKDLPLEDWGLFIKEQIDLEKPEFLHVVFVPLDDGSLRHGGVFNRYQCSHRLTAKEKPAGMDRKVPGEITNLTDQFRKEGESAAFTVEPGTIDALLNCPAVK